MISPWAWNITDVFVNVSSELPLENNWMLYAFGALSANHPEQVVKNYEKNARLGRFVVFVVPDEEAESKVKECLENVGKNFKIYILFNT